MLRLFIISLVVLCLQSCTIFHKNDKAIYRGRYNSDGIVIRKGNSRGLSYYHIKQRSEPDKVDYWIGIHLKLNGPEAHINDYSIRKSIYINGKYQYQMVGLKTECIDEEKKQITCESISPAEKSFLLFVSQVIERIEPKTLFTKASVEKISSWKKW